MNIQDWIRETQPGSPPAQDDQKSHPSVCCGATQKRELLDSRSHYTEPQAELAQNQRVHRKRTKHPQHPPSSLTSSTSHSSDAPPSASKTPSSDKYKRGKRHKTREDLYEPNSGIRKRRSRAKDTSKDKKKSKKKQESKHHRTERPKRVNKPGQQMLSNFNALNAGGPRLILHSPVRHGVFRNAKASSPQLRRGLPDLTFSEMRFLSKPVDDGGDTAVKDSGKASRDRKRHKSQEQEQISEFFSKGVEALREKTVNIQTYKRPKASKDKDARLSVTQDRGFHEEALSAAKNVRSNVQPPREEPQGDVNSESQYTWSPSEQAPDKSPVRPRPTSTIAPGSLAGHHGAEKGRVNREGRPSATHDRTIPREYAAAGLKASCYMDDHPEQGTPRCETAPSDLHMTSKPRVDGEKAQHRLVGEDNITDYVGQSSSPFAKLLQKCDRAVQPRATNDQKETRTKAISNERRPHHRAATQQTHRAPMAPQAHRDSIKASWMNHNHVGKGGLGAHDVLSHSGRYQEASFTDRPARHERHAHGSGVHASHPQWGHEDVAIADGFHYPLATRSEIGGGADRASHEFYLTPRGIAQEQQYDTDSARGHYSGGLDWQVSYDPSAGQYTHDTRMGDLPGSRDPYGYREPHREKDDDYYHVYDDYQYQQPFNKPLDHADGMDSCSGYGMRDDEMVDGHKLRQRPRIDEAEEIVPKGFWRPNILY